MAVPVVRSISAHYHGVPVFDTPVKMKKVPQGWHRCGRNDADKSAWIGQLSPSCGQEGAWQ